jgi:hypothetical protein
MFIGENRVIDSVLTLRYDRFLSPRPDRTIIYCSDLLDIEYIKSLYRKYQIDTQGFEFCHDRDLLAQHPSGDLVKNDCFIRHWYLKQQLYKLMALDICNDSHVLIADCDRFCIQPYQYFDHENPVLFGIGSDITNLANYSKAQYEQGAFGHPTECYRYITQLTGIQDFHKGNWASEFLPITKSQWSELKIHIEKYCKTSWVTAILTVLQHGNSYDFSEYCLLAQWLLQYNGTQVINPIQIGLEDVIYRQIKDRNWSTVICMPGNGALIDISQFRTLGISRHEPFTFEDIDYIYNTLALVLPS